MCSQLMFLTYVWILYMIDYLWIKLILFWNFVLLLTVMSIGIDEIVDRALEGDVWVVRETEHTATENIQYNGRIIG